jgi:hypothetical protein
MRKHKRILGGTARTKGQQLQCPAFIVCQVFSRVPAIRPPPLLVSSRLASFGQFGAQDSSNRGRRLQACRVWASTFEGSPAGVRDRDANDLDRLAAKR